MALGSWILLHFICHDTTFGIGQRIMNIWQGLTIDGRWNLDDGPEFEQFGTTRVRCTCESNQSRR